VLDLFVDEQPRMTVPASVVGWWRCCYCYRETDPNIHGEICPDCGHDQCYDCGGEGLVYPISTRAPVQDSMDTTARTTAIESLSSLSPPEDLSKLSDLDVTQNMFPKDDNPELVSLLPERSYPRADDLQRKLSRTSSLNSLAASLFSNLSGSSTSSIQGPEGAGERLAFILYSDPVLHPLFKNFERTALDHFERNLRRLLAIFSKDLYDEAQSTKERLVARFVRSQARKSATLICIELDPEGGSSGLDNKEQDDSASDSVDEDEEMVELQYFESIVLKSSALEKLRANLRQFIGSPENISTEDAAFTALEFLSLDNGLDMNCNGGGFMKDVIRMKNKIWRSPPLAKGMKRVTWTCVSISGFCAIFNILQYADLPSVLWQKFV
jgi:hypothetical protein